jgi:O-antigen ligase
MLSNKPYPRRPPSTAAHPSGTVPPAAPPPKPAGIQFASLGGSFGPAPEARDNWEDHSLRKIFFNFALAALFLRLSVIPELIASLTGADTYLLYLVAPPALIGTLLMGGLGRTFRARAAYLWVGFYAWMIVSTPFSSWKGGSTGQVIGYGRTEIIFLVLTAGLAITWRDVRKLFYTVAAAAVVNLATAHMLLKNENGRVSLDATGTIGNSNDLAAHLLLVLPFLLYFVMGRSRAMLTRVIALGLITYGLWVILETASRGAVVALMLVGLCVLARATPMQRIALFVGCLVLGTGLIAILPGPTAARLGTLVGGENKEADESADSRWYLFKKSVEYTMEHPIVGVGPNEFANYEGKASLAQGQHGNWHATHCAFTQVSAECGIPALLFFAAALGSVILMVRRAYRRARREGYEDVANMCFCYLLAMVGYLGALVFLAEAYSYQLPAMIGLGIALAYAAQRQMTPTAAPAAPAPNAFLARFQLGPVTA